MYHIVYPQYIESIPLHYSIASILCLTTFFTMDVQKQPTRLSLFWDAQPLALHFTISIWWRLGNLSVHFSSRRLSSVVAGWWFQKTCPLESPRKLGIPKPPEIHGYIFFFSRIVGTESLFAHIRFIEILWIHQGSWFYGETMMKYDELWSILTKLWLTTRQYSSKPT